MEIGRVHWECCEDCARRTANFCPRWQTVHSPLLIIEEDKLLCDAFKPKDAGGDDVKIEGRADK